MTLMRKTLSEQIYDSLKKDILLQRIGFGEKLSNRELQKRFDVSSTPVRDAINHLYLDGLIGNITNGGAQVISFDQQFALDVNDVVLMLNSTAMRRAMERGIPDEMRRELDDLLDRQEAGITMEEHLLLDKQFHNVFFQYAGNRQLQTMYDHYHVLRELLMRYTYQMKKNVAADSVRQHREIVEAYYAYDIALSIERMERHYKDASNLFIQHLK